MSKTLKKFREEHQINERREPLSKEYWSSHRLLKSKSKKIGQGKKAKKS